MNTWENEKKPLWIKHYKNKTDNVPGLCCSVDKINHNSEWCAEAYMETDFSKVSDKNFIANVKKFNSYLYENDYIQDIDSNCVLDEPVELISTKSKFTFKYNDVFEINKPSKENTYNKGGLDDGDIHFVTATESNNGVSMLASIPTKCPETVLIDIIRRVHWFTCLSTELPVFSTQASLYGNLIDCLLLQWTNGLILLFQCHACPSLNNWDFKSGHNG